MDTMRWVLSVAYNLYLGRLLGEFLALELSARPYLWSPGSAWVYHTIFAIIFAVLSYYRQVGWSKLAIPLLLMALLGGIQMGDDLAFRMTRIYMGSDTEFREVYEKYLTIQTLMMIAGAIAGPLFWYILNDRRPS